MFILGLLLLVCPAAVGASLAWENRDVVVQLRVADFVWTGHLYAVLVAGVLLTCWFLLGVSLIRCRIAEIRQGRTAAPARSPRASAEPARRARSSVPVESARLQV